MNKNIKYLTTAFMTAAILCGLNGCGGIHNDGNTEQTATAAEDTQIVTGAGEKRIAAAAEEEQIAKQDHSEGMKETAPKEGPRDAEKAASGEDLDVVVPNPDDDGWYKKGNIYTDDDGNRLEVFFDDYGALQFAVNGLSLYFTAVDSYQQENNWKVYTCDDGTMIIYYPGEPAHLEITDGDYAGLYEAGRDKSTE